MLVIVGAMLACADGNVGPQLPRDLSTVLVNPAAMDSLVVVALQPRLMTGEVADREDYAFAFIRDIARHTDGRLYVLETIGDIGVRVYHANGAYIGRFGPKGDGPGELRSPQSIAIRGDTIFVLDTKLHLFDSNGRFLNSLQLENGSFALFHEIGITPDAIVVMRRESGRPNGDGIAIDRLEFYVVKLGELSVKKPALSIPVRMYPYGHGGHGPALLKKGPSYSIGENGTLFYATGDSLHIQVVRLSDGSIRHISGPVPPVPTTDADVEMEIQAFERFAQGANISLDASSRKQLREVPRAKYRSAVGRIISSVSGGLLIQRPDISPGAFRTFDPAAKVEWLLLDGSGKPTHRFSLPLRFVPFVLTDSAIIGRFLDTDDVPSVVEYHIPQK
jgi:hypothetical protein